jgi:thiazole synthase ThiGH ThiG subunit
MTPTQVAKRLGHADATLVLKLYAHAWDQQPEELAEMFDASVAAGKAAQAANVVPLRMAR